MSLDTHPDAAPAQHMAHRSLGPAGRVRIALEMSDEAREVSRAGIRARHPEYDHEEVESALLRLIYGDELFRAAWPSRPVRDP